MPDQTEEISADKVERVADLIEQDIRMPDHRDVWTTDERAAYDAGRSFTEGALAAGRVRAVRLARAVLADLAERYTLVPREHGNPGDEWRWRDLSEPEHMWNAGYPTREAAEQSIAQCNRLVFERRGLPPMQTEIQRRSVVRGVEQTTYWDALVATSTWETQS